MRCRCCDDGAAGGCAAVRASRRSGAPALRGALRALPRRRWQRRRYGAGHRSAADAARRSTAHQAHSRGPASQGHASHRRQRRRAARPDQVPAHHSARAEPTARPDDGADHRRRARWSATCSARASTTCSCGPTTSACTCCAVTATGYRAVTSETAMADLQRRSGRQPLHHADADRQEHRLPAGPAGCSRSLTPARCRARRSSSTASCTSPRPTRCMRARCRQRPAALAGQAAAHQGHLRRRRQPRCGGRRRPRLHGHRQRAHHRAQPLHRRPAVGRGARRLAQELRGVVGAAPGRRPDHLGRFRRRAWRQRFRRRARPGDRQGSVALLDRAEAGRAWLGNLAGVGHRARRRADLVHGQLRSGARPGLLADREPEQGIRRQATARATTSMRARSSRSTARPARSSGTTSSRRTISGIGMRRRPRCSSTPTGRASAGR